MTSIAACSPATAKDCGIDPARDKKPLVKLAGYGAARQRYDNPDQKTGGFPGGMLRKASCEKLPDEASCGRLAKTGFNDCIALRQGPQILHQGVHQDRWSARLRQGASLPRGLYLHRRL